LGYPTANLKLKTKVPSGVYAGRVFVGGKKYRGAIFIPEVKKSKKIAEVYILDFSDNLYGQEIAVVITEKIREERKFKNFSKLKKQIKRDVEKVYLYHF